MGAAQWSIKQTQWAAFLFIKKGGEMIVFSSSFYSSRSWCLFNVVIFTLVELLFQHMVTG